MPLSCRVRDDLLYGFRLFWDMYATRSAFRICQGMSTYISLCGWKGVTLSLSLSAHQVEGAFLPTARCARPPRFTLQ